MNFARTNCKLVKNYLLKYRRFLQVASILTAVLLLSGIVYLYEIQETFYMAVLSGSLLIVISFILTNYLVTLHQLTRFPERNPNPVLSLNGEGGLRYCNPGATNMADLLGLASVAEMLPNNLEEKLAAARLVKHTGAYWEYKLSDYIFSCRICYQSDFDSYHVYLADITSYKQTEEKLQYLAYHDALTRLPNRHSFEGVLDGVLQEGYRGAVLLLCPDRFRFLVEALGHAIADQGLVAIAKRLMTLNSDKDPSSYIYHFERDIFAILLPRMNQVDDLQKLTRQLTELMRDPFVLDEREMFLSLSIGSCVFPDDGDDLNTLLRHADTALQKVKRDGGNGIRRYLPQMDNRSLDRLELTHELRGAEKRGEMELYYQPQFDIHTEEIIGVEALIRWNHPERGRVSPADFIPLAEETGLIVAIGEWVLTTACLQNKEWQDAGLEPMIMAVNISPRQFQSPDMLSSVQQSLEISGLDPCWLELELTEGTAMHDPEITATVLNALKSLGTKLSIDDFGTGYSSLAYLKRFPIDKLKIDQSFVRNMTHDSSDAAIIKTIITLGHSLGLKLIAEGVETRDQLVMLEGLGCEEMQGYLLGKPQPQVELSLILNEAKMRTSQV